MKYIWRNVPPKPTDDSELRVLRQMVEANDTMMALNIITKEEYDQTLAYVESRVSSLEDKYGLDHAA